MDEIAQLRFSDGTLLLDHVSAGVIESMQGRVPWVWDPRIASWRSDAIHYATAARLLRVAGVSFEDHVGNWTGIEWPAVSLPELRPEQQRAVDAWMAVRRGQIIMPTGTGKTEVALAIMERTQVGALVVAPVRDLMYQWQRRIHERLGFDAGIIGDSCHDVRPVSVTTYDSACIHMERLGDKFGLLVFDESHHLPGPMRRDAALMSAAPFRLGLTATPERSDRRHLDLDWLVGPIVFRVEIPDARGKTLADYEIVRIPVKLSVEEDARYKRYSTIVRDYVARRREHEPDFSWQDLCADTARDKDARRAMRAFHAKKSIENRAEEKLRVLEDLFRLHSDGPCIVFAGSNAMARDISQRFLIPCLLSHCGKQERLEVLRGLENGTYPALVANQVLDEGVDLPTVKVAMVVGGTSSARQAKQRLGRILRRSGEARATLYEIVCEDTKEVDRSRTRRRSDAYKVRRQAGRLSPARFRKPPDPPKQF
ncbi:MAG: DEAD/DEAH box helicase [Planctomycetes bacterium]|nr:DEAD/DEAH box helicase [Planctomycetota bacterium]